MAQTGSCRRDTGPKRHQSMKPITFAKQYLDRVGHKQRGRSPFYRVGHKQNKWRLRREAYPDSVGHKQRTYPDRVGHKQRTYPDSVGHKQRTYPDSVRKPAQTDRLRANDAVRLQPNTQTPSG